MRMRFLLLISGVAAVTFGGCDNPAGPRPTAVLQASATPSPIAPVVCPASNCGTVANQLEATAALTVRETAGVAGVIETMNLVLRRNSDNVIIVNATPSVNSRFGGNGSVNVPVAVHWDRDQMTSAATLTVTVNARDDNQHSVTTTVTIPVAAFGG